MSATILSKTKRSGASTIVGLLACQADSYLQSLKTRVVSCNKADKDLGYEVEFENTVLFPEGGGQPFDTGVVVANGKEIPVSNVQRDGLTAVHIVQEELVKDSEVELKVDWARRWDHMQQHTGQHVLSAVLDRRNIETLGWNLGPKFCYIELPRKLSSEEVSDVQQECNDYIFKSLPIKVEQHQDKATTDTIDHKVPENYDLSKGVMRVVHISDLDANPCCGTHLANTSHIGTIALLHSQPIRGTNSRLFFLAGDRVARYAAEINEIVRKANAALSCQTEDIEEKINGLNNRIKELNAKERAWSAQVAKYEAGDIRHQLEANKFAILYKQDGTNDYLRLVEKELGKLKAGEGTVLLFTGLGKQGGSIVLYGDEADAYAVKVKELVKNVKGGGKGRFQGKVTAWEKGEIDSLLKISL
ncbi:putative alanine--tRNA ligase [Sugiyamaella lignohabitans]|uniref:Putative alanine--tRNA ligase n=1 Tax=Sugiyamaella lignohabitans TaxID=796027 RepID=A0A167DC65_9ASCO|nr:putative alanine--tRNA ligase [Sugiyamaella lignohabitans]ANB12746.1 putative alanine--tRNA ligase [Sugiyamaella lignohabitans]